MNKKCETCNWNFNGTCVHESEYMYTDKSQYTENCIGWLDKNHERKLIKLSEFLIYTLGEDYRDVLYNKTYSEMIKILDILKINKEKINERTNRKSN